jgi:hypothetical protein
VHRGGPSPIDFETEYRNGNLSFRIPLQTFGLGLTEAIQVGPFWRFRPQRHPCAAALGIGGIPNRSGNDGTIIRFAWKGAKQIP